MRREEIPATVSAMIERSHDAHGAGQTSRWTFDSESVARRAVDDLGTVARFLGDREPRVEMSYSRKGTTVFVDVSVFDCGVCPLLDNCTGDDRNCTHGRHLWAEQ